MSSRRKRPGWSSVQFALLRSEHAATLSAVILRAAHKCGVSKDGHGLSCMSLAADPARLAAKRRAPQDDGNCLRGLPKNFSRFLIPGSPGGLMIAAVLFEEGARSR